jgi:hypothetical protein
LPSFSKETKVHHITLAAMNHFDSKYEDILNQSNNGRLEWRRIINHPSTTTAAYLMAVTVFGFVEATFNPIKHFDEGFHARMTNVVKRFTHALISGNIQERYLLY